MDGSSLSAWRLVKDRDGGALGHFDLTIQGQVARIGRILINPACRGRGLAHVLIGLAIEKGEGTWRYGAEAECDRR